MKINLKNSLIILGIIILLLVIPTFVSAAVTYTREIPSNDGSIVLHLAGLTLDDSASYSYALTTKGSKPETWHSLVDYTNSTANVTLSPATADIVNVLKVADKGSLYIKNNSDDSYVVNAMEVNLKLPYLQAGAYEKKEYGYSFCQLVYNSIGNSWSYTGADRTFVRVDKITDSTFIQKFLDVKNNKKDISTLESSLPNCPTTGYNNERQISTNDLRYE